MSSDIGDMTIVNRYGDSGYPCRNPDSCSRSVDTPFNVFTANVGCA
jgi:hypothetical protein